MVSSGNRIGGLHSIVGEVNLVSNEVGPDQRKREETMQVTRRDLTIAGALAIAAPNLFAGSPALAEAGDEAAIKQNVEALREALLKADKAQLERLSADQLSYGHSDGKVQNKAEFIDGVMTRKATVKSITFPDIKVSLAGDLRAISTSRNRKPTASPTMSRSACSRSGKSRAATGSSWPAKGTSWHNAGPYRTGTIAPPPTLLPSTDPRRAAGHRHWS